jgi:hypothetical protein
MQWVMNINPRLCQKHALDQQTKINGFFQKYEILLSN